MKILHKPKVTTLSETESILATLLVANKCFMYSDKFYLVPVDLEVEPIKHSIFALPTHIIKSLIDRDILIIEDNIVILNGTVGP